MSKVGKIPWNAFSLFEASSMVRVKRWKSETIGVISDVDKVAELNTKPSLPDPIVATKDEGSVENEGLTTTPSPNKV